MDSGAPTPEQTQWVTIDHENEERSRPRYNEDYYGPIWIKMKPLDREKPWELAFLPEGVKVPEGVIAMPARGNTGPPDNHVAPIW